MPRRLNRYFVWRILGGGVRRRQPPYTTANPELDQLHQDLRDFTEPAPEDFLPSPPKPVTGFQKWPSPGLGRPVIFTYFLMTMLSIAEWGLRLPWKGDTVYKIDFWVSKETVFVQGEYWRLLSALFVHADFLHLLHNTMTFLFFGWILCGYFGRLAFPVLSLLIGIMSNLVTIRFHEANIRLLGASGMIYGMVAMWLTLYIVFDRTSPMPHRVMRSLGFSLMILFPQSYEPRVSYMAHASGFVTGIIVATLAIPLMRRTAPVLA